MYSQSRPGDALTPGRYDGAEDQDGSLHQFLRENVPLLLGVIRSYVVHMGLAHGEAVQAVASDILQDAVFEALAHADRFRAAPAPRAWFLAIAANVIKRRKAEDAKRHKREISISDLSAQLDSLDVFDYFDQLAGAASPAPDQLVEADEHVVEMLSLVSPNDQIVLRLALLHDLDMKTISQQLSITPGTARVRLHRALRRLRAALSTHQNERGESHA